jgi:integrase
MARIDLPHIQRLCDRHGHLRHYFRKPGFKRSTLPGTPGSAEFMDAYREALGAKRDVGADKSPPGSLSSVIAAYYQSSEWGSLQPQTQTLYRNVLDRFRDMEGGKFGQARAAALTDIHVKAILDKMADRPHMAQVLLKRLRGLFAFAVDRKLVPRNPTIGIKVKVRKTGGFRAWDDADIELFEAEWPQGSRARLALYLLLYTGQRRQDAVRMGRQMVRSGAMTITQLKRSRDQEPVTLTIPLHWKLLAEIERHPTDNLTFLMTEYGKPMSPFGFSNWFSDCANKAGLPARSSPHGLRKAAARHLAEAGASTLEIMSITGHASMKEVERYTRSASQARLARSAIAALEGEPGTDAVNPNCKPAEKTG